MGGKRRRKHEHALPAALIEGQPVLFCSVVLCRSPLPLFSFSSHQTNPVPWSPLVLLMYTVLYIRKMMPFTRFAILTFLLHQALSSTSCTLHAELHPPLPSYALFTPIGPSVLSSARLALHSSLLAAEGKGPKSFHHSAS